MKSVIARIHYILADLITANIALLIFDIARYNVLGNNMTGFPTLTDFLTAKVLILEQIVLPIIVLGVYAISGFYNRPFRKSHVQTSFVTVGSNFFNTLLIYFALLVNTPTAIKMTSYELLFYLFFALCFFALIGRLIVGYYLQRKIRRGDLRFNVLVAGNNPKGRALAEKIKQNSLHSGYNFVGFIALEGEPATGSAMTPEEAAESCRELNIAEIFVAPRSLEESGVMNILRHLFPLNLPIKIAPDALPLLNSSIRLQSIYEEPYIDVTTANITDSTRNIKRMIDICVSLIALLLLCIPMALIALLIKRDSKGPVIYKQERIGYHSKPFFIYKFRTMRTDAEQAGPMLSSRNDARITGIGRVLRKYRIDELPQFWNVLKGDMSLVGPRPEREYFIRQIMPCAPQYTLIHQVRPGITSWGMVKFGYASSLQEMVERVRYDLIYLANVSLTVDVKILIYTIKTVIKGRGK